MIGPETDKALAALATKLGTTADHLWTVLIRQAPISGMVDLIQYAGIAVGVYLWSKWARHIHQSGGEEIEWLPAGIVAVVLMIFVGMAFFAIQNTVAAFFNPEYWALNQVLSKV